MSSDRRTPLARAVGAEAITSSEVTPALLRRVPIFAETSEEALKALARVSMLRRVERGALVVREGEPIDFVYLILAGTLNVVVDDEDGREAILSMLGPGELFGEMGALDGQVRSATVIAVTPGVLVAIGKTDFKRCLLANFDVARFVMCKLAQRLRLADRRIESLALLDVTGRVVRLLREMADTEDGKRVVSAKLSRQDIAKMVGASREMVSRVVKDLESRGLIEEDAGRIVLLDPSTKQD
jgi:CRP/FNR family cyclic AMP-dependent transcriptional regulator